MRQVLITVLALLSFIPVLHADAWTSVVKKAQNAVVYIEQKEGSCTGFVINKKESYVMTAAHCAPDDIQDILWVDHVRGTIIALDTKKDLMVVKVPDMDPSHQILSLAEHNPDIRQDVMSVGYGYGLERPFFKTAHVADTAVMLPNLGSNGPFIGVDAAFTPGQSGGPILDASGNVVAIVQRGDSGTLGIGVGAETIKERMGRFFESTVAPLVK